MEKTPNSILFHFSDISQVTTQEEIYKEFIVVLYSEQIHLVGKRNDIKYTRQSWFQSSLGLSEGLKTLISNHDYF